MMNIRIGEFKTQNTLKSTQPPTFTNALQSHENTSDTNVLPQYLTPSSSVYDLPHHRNSAARTESLSEFHHISPEDIGNSSSLFDSSLASLDYTNEQSISSTSAGLKLLLFSKGSSRGEAQGPTKKMVNERSPTKAPLQSTQTNEQPTQQVAPAQLEKPAYPSSVPKFGQPTFPQSPLGRSALESNVFIKPKPPRPEYHKDQYITNHKDHYITSMLTIHNFIILVLTLVRSSSLTCRKRFCEGRY